MGGTSAASATRERCDARRERIGDVADLVQRALAGLSVANRQVVVLRFFADLTEQQTADALGIPTGTVKSRLSRAFAQLAEDAHLIELGRRST